MAKIKVLVADDEVTLTSLLKINLEQTGKFEVQTQNRGRWVAQAARAFRPDIILLDIMMPDMNGSDVANRLKRDLATRDIPILFLSALITKREIERQCGTVGKYAFLSKPTTTSELIDGIEKALAMSAEVEMRSHPRLL